MMPASRPGTRNSAVALVCLAGLALAGCGAGAPEPGRVTVVKQDKADSRQGRLTSFYLKLPDGRTVTCVGDGGASSQGGLSCDWEHVAAADSVKP